MNPQSYGRVLGWCQRALRMRQGDKSGRSLLPAFAEATGKSITTLRAELNPAGHPRGRGTHKLGIQTLADLVRFTRDHRPLVALLRAVPTMWRTLRSKRTARRAARRQGRGIEVAA